VAGPAATAPVPSVSSSSASAASSSSASSASAPFAGNAPFTVTASGTRYEAATLAAQVRAKLHATRPTGTGADLGTAPASALRGCVVHLTGGLPPRLVDRATYQGDPAYIIASSSHVWVVGLGCTAANSELIRSVALAG
jgi:hypothetical protein